METSQLTDDDRALIERVTATNERTFNPKLFDGGHVVAAGVQTADDTVYEGVSLPTAIGRGTVCAEPVAIGSAVAAGYRHDQIETCVAVSFPLPEHEETEQRVIPPCGVCREMLIDYNEQMRIIIPGDEQPEVVTASELLPERSW